MTRTTKYGLGCFAAGVIGDVACKASIWIGLALCIFIGWAIQSIADRIER